MTTASGQVPPPPYPDWNPQLSKITYINNLYSSSRAGIGTLNPQANLHVHDTLYPTLRFTSWLTGSTLQDGALMGYDANRNFFLYNNEAGNSFFGQSYAFQTGTLPFQDTSFYISSAGKVGVGTTSPSEKFQVNRGNVLIRGTNNFAAIGDEAVLYLGDNNHYIKSIVGGGLRIGTYGAANDIAVIENNGNMGLGTTTPSQKLEVGGGNVLIRGTNNFQVTGDEATLYLGDNNHYIKSIHGGGLRIGTFESVDAIAVFQHNGSVGIGTSNTGSFKLAVEGKIGAREVQVLSPGPWPDYVFADNYHLPTLKELKSFLMTYKHLPGLPTAKDVEKNGLDLGLIQKKHLEKTEELYLYLIMLHEEVRVLAEENKKLRSLLIDSQ